MPITDLSLGHIEPPEDLKEVSREWEVLAFMFRQMSSDQLIKW